MSPDAVVVGAGPNGLAAAITLARAGRSVVVYEASSTPGGGTRSAELTLPGFVHDVCSAIHPLVLASPFMREVPLEEHGLRMVHPEAPFAHPLDGGRAAVVERSVDRTAAGLGADEDAYRRLMGPLVERADDLVDDLLAPLRIPRHPLSAARFGLVGIRSAESLVRSRFTGAEARSLVAGVAAHSMLPLDKAATAGFGLLLALLAHAVGWPAAAGGSGEIWRALTSYLGSLGGEVLVDRPVRSMTDLPRADAYLFDVTPRQLLRIAGERLSRRYRAKLERFRYGPGVFKIDWALSEPIPWEAEGCRRAGTVHVGGDLEEIARSEEAANEGRVAERPYVLVAQQSVFDPGRAPAGRHTAWAYCHVPSGSTVDMTARIEDQIERFAPGFRDVVLARHTFDPKEIEVYNANYVGGDINAGMQDLRQHLARPTFGPNPYATSDPALYLCSASTPPGGGVHGLGGMFAARAALRGSLRERSGPR